MFRTKRTITSRGIELEFSKEDQVLFGFGGTRTKPVLFSEWIAAIGQSKSWLNADLERIRSTGNGDVEFDEASLFLSHRGVSELAATSLKKLGLPPHPAGTLRLKQKGSFAKGFGIEMQWEIDGEKRRANIAGALITIGADDYTLPAEVYQITQVVEELRQADKTDVGRLISLAGQLIELTGSGQESAFWNGMETNQPELSDLHVQLDNLLGRMRVRSATSVSLQISRKSNGINVVPILYGEKGGKSETDSILDGDAKVRFENDPSLGFFAQSEARRTYNLGDQDFLTVSEPVLIALSVVRQKMDEDAEAREAFAANPRQYIAEATRNFIERTSAVQLTDEELEQQLEETLEQVVFESEEYSNRVIELGLWKPPTVPIAGVSKTSWLPEEFGIQIGGKWVQLPAKVDAVEEAIEATADAIKNGQPTVLIAGEIVPANNDTLGALQALAGSIPEGPEAPKPEPQGPDDELVLVLKGNYDGVEYRKPITKRFSNVAVEIPSRVTADLLPHQRASFDWQVEAYVEGLPGILNADDQGLGKTLQTIAFMCWLQDNMESGRSGDMRPILVVAPASLLNNWISEVAKHCGKAGALGECKKAYGNSLKYYLKVDSEGKRSLELGLDDGGPKDKICWVLTTYDTLNDYQIEFGKIHFELVIFDEIQKIKSVSAKVHNAAKSVNAEFSIGLTGTPVENSIVDLWAIMDTLAPGYFGSVKGFMSAYKNADNERLKELHSKLFERNTKSDGGLTSALGLRRLKKDTIEGLPQKNYEYYPIEMSTQQIEAYEKIYTNFSPLDGAGNQLKAINYLRSVSLYPDAVNTLQKFHDMEAQEVRRELERRSARFKAMFAILDKVKGKGEKALIFLESVDMQYRLAEILPRIYDLEFVKIINGSTNVNHRQPYVDEFQAETERNKFNILILSPRAAGTGFTLTAANHVIHLSRWWNPAVEEQSNDRIFRIGQSKNCTIHIPLAIHPLHKEKSFDCNLNSLMVKKRTLFNDVVSPDWSDGENIADLMGEHGSEKFDVRVVDQLSSGVQFEDWVKSRLSATKKWSVKPTPRTGDKGCDLVAQNNENLFTALIQCKWTKKTGSKLDSKPIDEILNSVDYYPSQGGKKCVVISNHAGYTPSAISLAEKHNVLLIDRTQLALWPLHIL